ncbi:MAG: sigma-70 family RNA polymerase sigma factor [Rhodospirillales bacterium]|nr:sigma-70 family RNA polymerase sigma factor [Rhodospirillales bacterium]
MAKGREMIVAEIPHLRRYARALLRDPVEADDLVQSCLERALGRFHLWRPGSNLRPWLFTIMHNLFINAQRQKGRRPTPLPFDELTSPPAQAAPQDGAMAARHIAQALQQLPEEQRAAILLVGLEELSYAEAARVLGVPQGTVMSRLHRGREKLRTIILEEPAAAIRRIK